MKTADFDAQQIEHQASNQQSDVIAGSFAY